MMKFPDWLPAEVVSYAEARIKAGDLGEMKETLLCLVHDPDMAKVWKTFLARSSDSKQMIDYLEYVRLHPAVMKLSVKGLPVTGLSKRILDVPGDAIQRKLFAKVADSCEMVLNALQKLNPENDPQKGWRVLEQALQRGEYSAAEQVDTKKLEAIANFQVHLQEIQQSSSVVEILQAIKLAASLAIGAPDMPLPRKRKIPRAAINWLAMDLSSYMRNHFGQPLHANVASTVNAALGLYDDPINADYVRKLKPTS